MIQELKTCLLCHQAVDLKAVHETTIRAKLCGAVQYAVCPACGMEVPRPWTAAYKRQWTLRKKKNFERHKRSMKLARNKVKTGEWRKI